MSGFDWSAVISAGVSIAEGLLEDETSDKQLSQDKDLTILKLKDKERDRQSSLQQTLAQIAGQKEAAKISADASLEAQRKRILGDVLLSQGEGQQKAMLESFRANANRPERFNSAATALAQILSR